MHATDDFLILGTRKKKPIKKSQKEENTYKKVVSGVHEYMHASDDFLILGVSLFVFFCFLFFFLSFYFFFPCRSNSCSVTPSYTIDPPESDEYFALHSDDPSPLFPPPPSSTSGGGQRRAGPRDRRLAS